MRWRQSTKTQPAQLGFTIVEVMIVLAVTGLMFASVALVINGKQQQAQFQTSMNEVRSQIQQVASQVGSGYFPTKGDTILCKNLNGNISISTKSKTQASSGECNFIGKALHFYDGTHGTDDSVVSVFSLLGADNPAGGYDSAKPIVVAPADQSVNGVQVNPDAIDVTEQLHLNYGLKPSKLTFTNNAGTTVDIGSFGFAQNINPSIAGDATSGLSQHLDVIGFPTSLGNTSLEEANALNQRLYSGSTSYLVGGKVALCFASGGTNQRGTVFIGSDAGQIDVSAKIENGNTC